MERLTTLDVKKNFGKFILLRRIGAGGMAEVFLAEMVGAEGFSRRVALKRMLPHLSFDVGFTDSFKSEARLIGNLNHDNIVQAFDFGLEANHYYLAMEYVQGLTLADLLQYCRREKLLIPLPIVLDIVCQISDGLQYAHTATDQRGLKLRIVHRDLKPENILISDNGTVKITDFGVAKATSNLRATSNDVGAKGTIAYMSPEQAGCLDLDHRSDLYSLGAITFEMLTLERLYPHANGIPGLLKVREGLVEERFQLLQHLPDNLVTSLHRILMGDRQKRYQLASEFERDLHAVVASIPSANASLKNLVRETLRSHAPEERDGHYPEEEAGQISMTIRHLSPTDPPDPRTPHDLNPLLYARPTDEISATDDMSHTQIAVEDRPTSVAEAKPEEWSNLHGGRIRRRNNSNRTAPSVHELEQLPTLFRSMTFALNSLDVSKRPAEQLTSELEANLDEPTSPHRRPEEPRTALYVPSSDPSMTKTEPIARAASPPLEKTVPLALAGSPRQLSGSEAQAVLSGQPFSDASPPEEYRAPMAVAKRSSSYGAYVLGGLLGGIFVLFAVLAQRWANPQPNAPMTQLLARGVSAEFPVAGPPTNVASPTTAHKLPTVATPMAIGEPTTVSPSVSIESPAGGDSPSPDASFGANKLPGALDNVDSRREVFTPPGVPVAPEFKEVRPEVTPALPVSPTTAIEKRSEPATLESQARASTELQVMESTPRTKTRAETAQDSGAKKPVAVSARPKNGVSSDNAGPVGTVTINSVPFAKVFINNKDTGRTTALRKYPLPPGTYKMILETEDGRKSTPIEVTIVSGEDLKLDPYIF